MVKRLPPKQKIKGSSPLLGNNCLLKHHPKNPRAHRLMVRTLLFQGKNVSSILTGRKRARSSSVVERILCKDTVKGSTPFGSNNIIIL